MRITRIILTAALALSLAGCAGTKVGDFVSTVTTTIANPVRGVDIYRVKNVYAATLELFVSYRDYCWSKPYAVLMADPVAKPVCQNRRAVVRAVQQRRPAVAASIRTAENFVRNNPTLNAANVVGAAWQAVNDFKSLIPVR